jgi:hypothetical protein
LLRRASLARLYAFLKSMMQIIGLKDRAGGIRDFAIETESRGNQADNKADNKAAAHSVGIVRADKILLMLFIFFLLTGSKKQLIENVGGKRGSLPFVFAML